MAKKRQGRPTVEGERRSRSLRVAVTPTDYVIFQRLAKAERLSVSDWIRATLKTTAAVQAASPNDCIMSTGGETPKIPVQQKLKLPLHASTRTRRTKKAAA